MCRTASISSTCGAGSGAPISATTRTPLDLAEKELAEGRADLFSFGRPYLANPDLVGRLASGAPLAEAPKQYWYGGGATGYSDWRAWTGRYRYGAEPITEIGTSPIVTEATACIV